MVMGSSSFVRREPQVGKSRRRNIQDVLKLESSVTQNEESCDTERYTNVPQVSATAALLVAVELDDSFCNVSNLRQNCILELRRVGDKSIQRAHAPYRKRPGIRRVHRNAGGYLSAEAE